MAVTTETKAGTVRPPFWRDVKVLRVVAQVVALGGAIAFVVYLWNNLTTNLTADEPMSTPQ